MTINIYDVTLEVEGVYTPEEPRVMYDGNMEGYPGSAADFEIESVKLDGVEIFELLKDHCIELIKEKAIEYYE
jgi:hypothetical protein